MKSPQRHHLAATTLAAYADNELSEASRSEVAGHLAVCELCRASLAADQGAPGVPAATDLGGGATLPVALTASLAAARLPTPARAPAAGELWRLEAGQQAALALVLDVRDSDVLVVPVSFDVEQADDYTVAVTANDSPLDLDLALWVGLRTVVPQHVCERHLADLGHVEIVNAVHGLMRRRESASDHGYRVGRAISDANDPRVDYRQQLVETYAHLAAQHDEPERAGKEQVLQRLEGLQNGIRFVADQDADTIAELIRPLQPIAKLHYRSARARVCFTEHLPSSDALSGGDVRAAVDRAAMWRDVDWLLVVTDDDEFTSVLTNPFFGHTALTSPHGQEQQPQWASNPLPLEQTVTLFKERTHPSDLDLFAVDDLLPEPLDIRLVARDVCHAEVARLRASASSKRTPEKKQALGELDDTLADQLVELVDRWRSAGPGDLAAELEQLTLESS